MGRLTSVIAAILLCIVGPASLKAQDHTPDYRGDLWSRSTLTGDWGRSPNPACGKRRDVEPGFSLDSSESCEWGRDTTARWAGSSELVPNLNTQKLGLWPGGFLLARGEVAFKHGVNANTGSVMPRSLALGAEAGTLKGA
jgi:porin